MGQVIYGKIRHLLDRLVVGNGIAVIDPTLLFQSKCHCLPGLDQPDRQDGKHLRILCRVLPEHYREAMGDVRRGDATERALINEVKLLLRLMKTRRVDRGLQLIGIADRRPTSLRFGRCG